MKKFFNKYYHLFVIVAVAVALLGIRKMAVNTSSTKPVKHVASMVKINENQLKSHLNDQCKFSGRTLTCSKETIDKIVSKKDDKCVDSLQKVTEESITFYDAGGNYIDVPATVLVKMIDAGLFINTSEKK